MDIIGRHSSAIDEWFESKFRCYPAVLNTSVDLRSSGYKIAPVDANFFPAGYNNFGELAKGKTESAMLRVLSNYPGYTKALLIIERHTRNKKYVDNVIVLRDILGNIGVTVEVGACISDDMNVLSTNGTTLNVRSLVNCEGEVQTSSGFVPDFILLNNDLSGGMPEVLQGGIRQEIMPDACLGWFNRRKSRYFDVYKGVVSEFSAKFGLDDWLISAIFTSCHGIDFASRTGIEALADTVENLISQISEKFSLYGINSVPYVFIKANNGTYGMGIVEVYSGEDVLNMNKKNRNKMGHIKDNNVVESVVVQEGIPSNEEYRGHTAEPLLYYWGEELVCYLCRYNATRGKLENINVPGCAFADVGLEIEEDKKKTWHLVSKLAVLAAAMEASEMIASVNA